MNRSDSPGSPPGFWKLSYPGGVASPLTKDLSAYDGISLTRNRDSFATTKTDPRVDIWVGDGKALGGLKEMPPSGAVLPILGHGAGGSWINDRFWYSARSGSSRVASALSSYFRQAGKYRDAEAPTGPSDGSAVVDQVRGGQRRTTNFGELIPMAGARNDSRLKPTGQQ